MNNSKLANIKKDQSKWSWRKIPKWLLPIVVILGAFLIFLVAQYTSVLILSFYALFRGWDTARANYWLNNSITAQFLFVLMAEAFTVGLVYLVLRYLKHSLYDIGLKKPRFIDGGFAILAYPVYLISFLVLLGIATHLFPGINVNEAQQIGFNSVHGTYQLTLTFISLVILPPIAEEILFRGFLFEGLKKAMPVIWAALITSVIFASAHLPEGGAEGPFWVGAIDTFTLSLVLVFLKQKTKSLWPSIFLHAIKNAVAFVTLFVLANR
jgi:membrane protease YdiL (CAAX protease family)